jgi:hypothetical protein
MARAAASYHRQEHQLRGGPFGNCALGCDGKGEFESILMHMVQPPDPYPDVHDGTLPCPSLYGIDNRAAQP